MPVRRTKQRDVILETMRSAEGPLTARQVHERAVTSLTGIGIATVYRALDVLLKQGEIIDAYLPGDERYYEQSGKGDHHHFICSECGRVLDLRSRLFTVPLGTVLPDGFVILEQHLTFHGSCPNCAATHD